MSLLEFNGVTPCEIYKQVNVQLNHYWLLMALARVRIQPPYFKK